MRERIDDRLKAGSDARDLLVEILDEDTRQEQDIESEMGPGGHDYDELTDSLASRPVDFDMQDSAYNVFSLMNSMNDTPDDFALVIEGKEGESELESDFEMLYGLVSEAKIPPVSVAGVHKSRYKGAWLWAINEEMKGLKESGTFMELKGLPEGEKAIGSRWVLSYKSDKDDNITKTRARLVAKGFMQGEGVDYTQTAAPTPAATSVKTVLAVANQMGFTIYHLDVKQAYTKANL